MRGPRLAAVAVALALVAGACPLAMADERAACEVLMIHALREGEGIDGRLSQLRQLRETPFNAYNTFRLVRRARLQLTLGSPETVPLPTGRTLQLTLTGRHGNRLKFQVSINRPRRSDYLPGLEYVTQRGEPFFQAGQTYERGVLVLGFVCR